MGLAFIIYTYDKEEGISTITIDPVLQQNHTEATNRALTCAHDCAGTNLTRVHHAQHA